MLYNLKLKTSDNESLSINDVDYIGLGDIAGTITPTRKEELFINCRRGQMKFPISKIKSIEFTIKNDEHVLKVASNETPRKDKNNVKRRI